MISSSRWELWPSRSKRGLRAAFIAGFGLAPAASSATITSGGEPMLHETTSGSSEPVSKRRSSSSPSSPATRSRMITLKSPATFGSTRVASSSCTAGSRPWSQRCPCMSMGAQQEMRSIACSELNMNGSLSPKPGEHSRSISAQARAPALIRSSVG
eukprot:scaffold74935_cov33-Phaeocystis_antarctica.AAC.1